MKKKKKLVYGVGFNDVDYIVKPTINGEQVCCPFYQTWYNILNRCYAAKYQARYPTYTGCTVCEEWLTFSNFKSWMEQQNWQGKQLDKDLLFIGNKVYSPENCVFVSQEVNLFLTDNKVSRGEYVIGVCFHNKVNKFQAQCKNIFTKKVEHLGYFPTELEAHKAWQAKKHEYACQLADLQQDPRVAKALRERYAPDKDWTNR